MSKTVFANDVVFTGNVSFVNANSVNHKPGNITNADISNNAGIDPAKLQHSRKPGTGFNLAIGGTPASREEIVFVAGQAGTITGFHALCNDTGTATDLDFDLKVNGASVLAAAVNITHGTADRATVDGSVSTPSISAGDVISISLDASGGATGAQGPYAWVDLEDSVT